MDFGKQYSLYTKKAIFLIAVRTQKKSGTTKLISLVRYLYVLS
jgi:hypothetical protein